MPMIRQSAIHKRDIVFTNLTAVLASYSYRMLALFREARIIHNPRHHRAMFLNAWQQLTTDDKVSLIAFLKAL
jgi:hypothetical protein